MKPPSMKPSSLAREIGIVQQNINRLASNGSLPKSEIKSYFPNLRKVHSASVKLGVPSPIVCKRAAALARYKVSKLYTLEMLKSFLFEMELFEAHICECFDPSPREKRSDKG